MFYKGLIVKIENDYAIALTDENKYMKISLKDNLAIGQKIMFVKDDLIAPNKNRKDNGVTMKNKIIAFAVAACLILTMIVGTNLIPTQAFALVSIDINPSLDIKVSEDATVLEIIALNDDALQIINDQMIGKEITIVIDEIIKNAEDLNFLNEDHNNILISSATFKKGDINTIGEKITSHIKNNDHLSGDVLVIYVESDKDKAEKSLKDGVSLGKLQVSEIVKNDEVQNFTVTEMVNNEEISTSLSSSIISKNDLEKLNRFLAKLEDVSSDDFDASAFLAYAENAKSLENPDIKLLLTQARDLWNEYEELIEDIDESVDKSNDSLDDIADLNELISKLEKVDDDDVIIFLAKVEIELTSQNPDIRSLKNEAKSLWEQFKDSINDDSDDDSINDDSDDDSINDDSDDDSINDDSDDDSINDDSDDDSINDDSDDDSINDDSDDDSINDDSDDDSIEDLSDLYELIDKLESIADDEIVIREFLALTALELASENPNIEELKDDAKKLWDQYKDMKDDDEKDD